MRTLYENEFYRSYLQKRNLKQTIMLGFSDSTKDGGYVTANWSIYHCKLQLFLLGHDHNIDTLFFDGRGGPPARGGGNTHKFYRAIASTLPLSEIQLTIQGQTITTNFGTLETAKYHIEQLYTSGLMTSHFHLFKDSEYQLFKETLSYEDIERLDQLSNESFTVYKTLVNNPLFLKYLSELTPMNYYGDLNIASRPPRRDQQESPTLDNLRAITFVSAWSQMKQNIPGFYGLGTSLNNMIERGELKNLQRLYKENLFFHTLLDNAMQSLLKTQFSITQHLRTDPEFGSFWLNLKREADTTTTTLLQVSQQSELLADDFLNRASIQQREMIVLPLQIIQQYALMKARELRISGKETSKEVEIFHKIILKTIATNINASRNSA